jgi:hypothetical protein
VPVKIIMDNPPADVALGPGSVFGVAAVVALKFPLMGLGMCCCCLIVYLKPEAPGAEKQQSR